MKSVGIILNGVTGRMGTHQHLVRSLLAIRGEGGVLLANGSRLYPEPILLGRNETKLRELAGKYGLARWSTDAEECLSDASAPIYFDAQVTSRRTASVRAALAKGKHVYCEKPLASSVAEALELARLAKEKGCKNGVVQDKLFLPGLRKLKRLIDGGFFGRILSIRGEFGYWVFEGGWQAAQRPSWNYRREDGGGIILDMFAHWQYVLEGLFGRVESLLCHGATHIGERFDENGRAYPCTADDSAYAIFQIAGGAVAQMNSSWAVRVHRDELLEIQVDGTEGSAVAGLRDCRMQHRAATPKSIWNPDIPSPWKYREHWQEVPDNEIFENAFKVQWEAFLRHVAEDTPFPHTFLDGARGVQIAELGMNSWRERRWIDVPELALL